MEQIGVPYLLILIDDGSTDTTWQVCQELQASMTSVRAVRFSRNFGKEAAILCGLREAPGDAVVIMDSDLQHPPSVLPEMIRKWQEDGCDVVETVKVRRGKEPLTRRLFARLFYAAMRILSGFDIARLSDYKLLSRRVVQAYIDLPETNRFFRGLIAWLGFRSGTVQMLLPDDEGRTSRFSWAHLIHLALSAITAFSYVPLQMITLAGVVTFVFSFLLGIQTLYMKWSGQAVEGFTTVILVVLFAWSNIMLSLGVIGEYLARIFDELKRRPNYVVTARLDEMATPSPQTGNAVDASS